MDWSELKHSYALLHTFNDITFTKREIDVISCIMQGRTSKKSIAAFLTNKHKPIQHRAVEFHTHNIIHKLNGGCWEDIRDAIEKSDRVELFRKHYEILKFDHLLQEMIPELPQVSDAMAIKVFFYFNHDKSLAFKHDLEETINYFYAHGLSIQLKAITQESDIDIFLNDSSPQPQYIFYDETIYSPPDPKSQNMYFFGYSDKNNIYTFIFLLLRHLCNNQNLMNELEKQLEKIIPSSFFLSKPSSDVQYQSKNIEKYKLKKLVAILVFFLIFSASGLIKFMNSSKEVSIHSKLMIPNSSVLLKRPLLIQEIQSRLFSNPKSTYEIPIVVLVGDGGSGKTTLARMVAKSSNVPLVWEINAENHGTLLNSFEDLAVEFATTPSKKSELSAIEQLNDMEQRKKRLLAFVKRELNSSSKWLLTFDNVPSFSLISPYVPDNRKSWGNGLVIITTRRDQTAKADSIKPKNVILLKDLLPDETLALFTRVRFDCEPPKLPLEDREKAEKFLTHLPQFPLDISIAAKYLANHSLSYEEYLHQLQTRPKELSSNQVPILQGTTDYTKTRYNIITTSLKEVLTQDKGFASLILTMCLVGSQNIPKELLDRQHSQATTTKLLIELKKHNLITHESIISDVPVVSWHRSTQDICRQYLIENLSNIDDQVNSVSKEYEIYMEGLIDKAATEHLNLLEVHCSQLYNDVLLNAEVKRRFGVMYGCLHYHLEKNLKKAQHLLEESLLNLNDSSMLENDIKARALMYLGDIYRIFGESKKAKEALQQSVYLYKSSSNQKEYAHSVMLFGCYHWDLHNHKEAKELLEHSISLCQSAKCANSVFSDTYRVLGALYRELGDYPKAYSALNEAMHYDAKDKFDELRHAWTIAYLGRIHNDKGYYTKSRKLFEEVVQLYKARQADQTIYQAWLLTYLAGDERVLGKYQEALNILEQTLVIYKNNNTQPATNDYITFTHMGKVYRKIGSYYKALELLKKVHHSYVQLWGECNLRTLWVASALGEVYRDLGNYKLAQQLFEKCLDGNRKQLPNWHPKIGKNLIHLGQTLLLLGDTTKARSYTEEGLNIYIKHYGTDHLRVAEPLRNLGEILLAQGYSQKAEQFINRSLEILKAYSHPDQHLSLECLAFLYKHRAKEARGKGLLRVAAKLKQRAHGHLKKAQKIIKCNFPKDSIHINRVQQSLGGI